jgi:hypothetical protein
MGRLALELQQATKEDIRDRIEQLRLTRDHLLAREGSGGEVDLLNAKIAMEESVLLSMEGEGVSSEALQSLAQGFTNASSRPLGMEEGKQVIKTVTLSGTPWGGSVLSQQPAVAAPILGSLPARTGSSQGVEGGMSGSVQDKRGVPRVLSPRSQGVDSKFNL